MGAMQEQWSWKQLLEVLPLINNVFKLYQIRPLCLVKQGTTCLKQSRGGAHSLNLRLHAWSWDIWATAVLGLLCLVRSVHREVVLLNPFPWLYGEFMQIWQCLRALPWRKTIYYWVGSSSKASLISNSTFFSCRKDCLFLCMHTHILARTLFILLPLCTSY